MQESIETLRNELEERLRFETLLAEISAHFVNLPADRLDSEIEGAQRRICEFLNLDRSSLGQVPEEEPGDMILTHIHQSQGSPPVPKRPNLGAFFPWAVQKTLAGETTSFKKISDLPLEAGRDRESYALYGIKSVCDRSVISWRRANLWPVDIQCPAGGERLAGNDREGLPACCASFCQRSRPKTR